MIKKILFLVNHDVVIYNFRLEIVERLLDEGYEVHISSPRGSKIDKLVDLGCKFHEIEFNRHGTNLFEELRLLKTYQELMKEVNPAVVLTYTIKPNIYGGLVARKLKIPYLTNITGLGNSFSEDSKSSLKYLLKTLYITALKDAKCVYFQNVENQSIFNEYKLYKGMAKLLPGSGVNLERFYYRPYIKDTNINIVYFGRIMGSKGVDELLETAKVIYHKYKNVNFHLVGFSENPKLLRKVEEYHDLGYIQYHGYQADVMPYMEMSDAVIQPSYHEGMSNVLLEASASGRPVLASNIHGCKEIIENGITGLLFEPKNIESLTAAVEKFLSISAEDRELMGRKAREKVKNEFSREIIVDEYMSQIKQL